VEAREDAFRLDSSIPAPIRDAHEFSFSTALSLCGSAVLNAMSIGSVNVCVLCTGERACGAQTKVDKCP
jgi:uncharacterized protein (DUF169 family)